MKKSVNQNHRESWHRLSFSYGATIILAFFLPVSIMAGQVDLEWIPNSDPEIDGYVVYWGTASRHYSESVDVGNHNSYTLSGLNDESTYYFSVTAYDWTGNESSYSNEVYTTVSTMDSDEDGLIDSDEIGVYGTNPMKADTDDDGADDGLEVLYASDPLDGESIPYCAADFDQNGSVSTSDVTLFMAKFGGLSFTSADREDFDSDGDADGKDFFLLIKAFGKSGCP